MTPATRASRGTKRICQNDACGLPFYDLNRSEIVCPNCASAFVPPPPQVQSPQQARYASRFGRPGGRAERVLEIVQGDEPVAEPVVDAPGDGEIILEVDDDEDPLALEVSDEPDKEE